MNLTRRELMKLGLGATALAGTPRLFSAATAAPAPAAPNLPLLTKTIPSTGEKIPVVGIGTRTYANVTDEIRLVLRELGESGCTMVDTARGYGESEVVIGDIPQALGNRAKLFLATKVGGGGKAEIEASFTRLRTDKIDLHYVWNLTNTDTNATVTDNWLARTSSGPHQPSVLSVAALTQGRTSGQTRSKASAGTQNRLADEDIIVSLGSCGRAVTQGKARGQSFCGNGWKTQRARGRIGGLKGNHRTREHVRIRDRRQRAGAQRQRPA